MLKNKKITAILLALGFSIAGKSAYAADSTTNEEENNKATIEQKATEESNKEDVKESDTNNSTDESKNSKVEDKDSEKDSNEKTDEDSDKDNIFNLKSDKKQWMNVKGKYYYVTENGLMEETGWFKEKDINEDCKDNNIYYINEDHSAAIGWLKLAENWYYFNEKGVMQTGWQKIEGKQYYLDKDGEMLTGWVESENGKYYLNQKGVLLNGKQEIEDKWYIFGENNALKTGFFNYDGKTYYADKDGALIQNQYITVGDNKYYAKCDGTIAKGNVIINGKTEEFDNQGKHIGTKDIGEYLYVKYLGVGSADCAFIKLPNGETALIDTGDVKTKDKVVDFLKKQNLKDNTIDYIVVTHAHSDHIGGLSAILKNFNVKKVYLPEIAVMQPWHETLKVGKNVTQADIDMIKLDYDVYKDAEKAMTDKNMKFINTVNGEYIDSQKILKFVEPDMDFSKDCINGREQYWRLNQNSAIVYLDYSSFKGLFMGDASNMVENYIAKNDMFKGIDRVDSLKAGHHGLDSASTYEFINYVKPDIAILSRGIESVAKNYAYNNIVSNGSMTFETSANDNNGFSIYANKENWNGEQ